MYDELVLEAELRGIHVVEMELEPRNKGFYYNGAICISTLLSTKTEKRVVLGEEWGHGETTVGNIRKQKGHEGIPNRKQERRARGWAHHKLAPLDGLIGAYLDGARNRHEIAEFLYITEPFLDQALVWYREKLGFCACVDNYIIWFDPLAVGEIFMK